MRQGSGCAGGLAVLIVVLSASAATAQDGAAGAEPEPQRRWMAEAALGLQTYYRGDIQSFAFGFTPTRSLALLVSAERSHVQDSVTIFEDGYGAERGGRDRFISLQFRYAFLPNRRISPYVLVGAGRGVSRSNQSDLFPDRRDYDTAVFYYGGGARIPIRRQLDAFVDWRVIWSTEARSDYLAVRGPLRAGLAWRF